MQATFFRRHRVALASGLVVATAAGALVAYALADPGYASHHAEINDGGVWVTRGETGQFGRLNKPIDQLDGYAYTENSETTYDIDVAQEGASVLAIDRSAGELYPVDVTGASLVTSAKIPLSGQAAVAINAGTVAVVDPAKGAVRALTVATDEQLQDLSALASPKPLAVAGHGAAVAVDDAGDVYAASSTALVTLRRSGSGFAKPTSAALDLPAGSTVSVTTVGTAPVVLARSGGTTTLVLPGGHTRILPSADVAKLQASGPRSAVVVVATSSALLAAPLDGGAVSTLAKAGGTPAAPVQLGPCLFAAWAGSPGHYATSCGSSSATVSAIQEATTDLVFRVNRGKVMLNDRPSGKVFDLDTGKPRRVDNWAAVTKPREDDRTHSKNDDATNATRPQPPLPRPDDLGARPGRTTSLYVLDNDSDPSGGVLAVSSVTARGAVGRMLSISPDGQTVDLSLPPGYSQPVSFSYTINGAKGTPVSADVTVDIRTPSDNAPPVPRRNVTPRTWSVPAGGTVTIPVLGDWRDYVDGDTVVLNAASTQSGSVATTPDGQLIYTAPDKPGPQRIDYVVSDGTLTAKGTVALNVQAATDSPIPATAAADYARGRVGSPITISPLANDLPGSDPANPAATLRLAGDVASPAGATVTNDLTTGTVTVVASRPGPLTLTYRAAYGYATPAKGIIAVQVDPAGKDTPPVTAPDTAVLHGQNPVVVDVLANDADPDGRLLVVQRATPASPDLIEAAVIDGRYVRLRSLVPSLSPAVQTVAYTVSDGVTGDVQGSVTVTQLPPTDAAPVALDDYARVRSGQSVAVPVLDNDTSPSGSPLTLSKNVFGAPHPGQLPVTPASAGSAYISGRVVRFVARPTATTVTADVTYVCEDVDGNPGTGHLNVTIVPPPNAKNPNQSPVAPPLEGRATAGQTIRINVPSAGVDPDGDPVVVTGIASAPSLGRILSTSARGLTYQAFPFNGNGGTDTFSYVVSDIWGATSTGTVRVAVVTPGDPQPPVAVDDTLTTSPGARVQIDVLANDFVAPGDNVTIEPLSRTNGDVRAGRIKLTSSRGPIAVTAGDAKHPVQFFYTVTNGISSARAQVTVRAVGGANLPPIAFDRYPAVRPGATSVEINLATGNYDPDGTAAPRVVSPAPRADGLISLPLTKFPQVVPYVIADAQGATATAVVYLPAVGAGAPYLKPGSLLRLKSGQSTTVDVTSYVLDPSGRPIHTTVQQAITAAPARQLTVGTVRDGQHIPVTTARGYNGPAALTFQVTDGTSLADPKAVKAFVSIPVQIGDDTPVLHCPSGPVTVVEGGTPISIHPATYCHVWAPDLTTLDTMSFTARWSSQPAGVGVRGSGTPSLTLTADSANSRAGAVGTLAVTTGAATAALKVQVVAAPRMHVSPLTIDGVQAGRPHTIDLTSSLQSSLAKPTLGFVGTPTVDGSAFPATITTSGPRMTITPSKDAKGTLRIRYVATDVPQLDRADRQAPGEIVVHIIGHPDAPTNVQPGRTVLSKTVTLTWTPPAANGTPISRYVAMWTGGQRDCGAAPSCTITGLKNAIPYTFTVTAWNAIGPSPRSDPSAPATPDAVPPAVQGFTASNPQDHTLTLTWRPVTGDFSPVISYRILGGPEPLTEPASVTSIAATNLDNNAQYTFSIIAINKKGSSPATSSTGSRQSAGRPDAPQNLTVGYADDTATDSTKVQISWNAVQGASVQGPTPVTYTLTRTPGGVVQCGAGETTCYDSPAYGQSYTYSVVAHNGAEAADPGRHTSTATTSDSFEVATRPDAVSNYTITATGNNGEATVTYDAPASHGGTSSTIKCSRSDGGTCGPWTAGQGGAAGQTQTVMGLPNGHATDVVLQVCNDTTSTANAARQCGDSVTRTVTTYGPIAPVQLSVTKNGTRIYWSYSGDANGKSAHVSVRTSHGYTKDYDTAGQINDSDSEDVGYSSPDTVTVTVTDPARPTQSATQSQTTDPQPVSPPTISNYIVVLYTGQHVGIAWDTTYQSGSEGQGGQCHWTIDGASLANPLDCGYNGRASRQFYSQPTGTHTYCGFVQMPDGRSSNVLCKTVTVS